MLAGNEGVSCPLYAQMKEEWDGIKSKGVPLLLYMQLCRHAALIPIEAKPPGIKFPSPRHFEH